jgi:hypothetical protein
VILPVVPESILPLTLANYPNPEKDQPGEDKDIRQRRVNQMCQKITHFSPFFSLLSKRNNRHFVLSILN